MTSTLLEIPADSRTARDIARMEDWLCRLRDVAVQEGVAELFSASDERRGGGLVPFSQLQTRAQSSLDALAFYGCYGLEWRSQSWPGDLDLARAKSPGPQWFRFSTEDRFAWSRVLPKLLEALRGLPLDVSRSTSWRWDRKNLTSSGQATYVPVYEALLSQRDPSHAFEPERCAESMLKGICLAEHPLAATDLFEWQKAKAHAVLFNTYRWSREGFHLTFYSKKNYELACELLLCDLVHVLEPRKAREPWVATVTLGPVSSNSAQH